MSVPTRFRGLMPDKGDGRQLIITLGMTGDCLWAYPQDEWKDIEAQIKQTKSSLQKDAFVRNFIGNAHDCAIDKMGRVLIPAVLREKAALEKQVVIVGALQKFEIWDQDVFKGLEESKDSLALAQDFYNSEEIRI